MSDQASTTETVTAPSDTTNADRSHLDDAVAHMRNLARFTEQVVKRLDEGYVHPDQEARWRGRQDAMMELARTNALVSIAESLAVIAGRARPASAPAGGDTDAA
ncbi:hypothetical protein E1091_10260 [Micromonospora fluostatini]|uniref:Uncharacterized protein n=1 Tax=Micromonospora fluostatini TaxID=1629071 RepID=A0ABY2DLN6_9ACTN|nr:hypothetical protein E1091_10260 [Micromonospora fluostatini]